MCFGTPRIVHVVLGNRDAQVGSRMFLFGGKGEKGALFRDLFFLDLVKWTWVPVSSTTEGPSPRMNHASVLVGRKMVVQGGWDGVKRSLDDLWVFDTEAFTWVNPKTAGLSPTPRYGHQMQLLDDGRILVFGGITVKDKDIPEVRPSLRGRLIFCRNGLLALSFKLRAPPTARPSRSQYHKDLRQLDTETMLWSKPRAAAAVFPSARYGHSASQLGGQLVVFGGWGVGGLQSSAENKRAGAESLFTFDPEVSAACAGVGACVVLSGLTLVCCCCSLGVVRSRHMLS